MIDPIGRRIETQLADASRRVAILALNEAMRDLDIAEAFALDARDESLANAIRAMRERALRG